MAGGRFGTAAEEVVRVPSRRGIEAVDILRLRGACGAVLHDHEGRTLGFLVPPGTAATWNHPGGACAPSPLPPHTSWLIPPTPSSPHHTDPAALRAALDEATRTLAAAAP